MKLSRSPLAFLSSLSKSSAGKSDASPKTISSKLDTTTDDKTQILNIRVPSQHISHPDQENSSFVRLRQSNSFPFFLDIGGNKVLENMNRNMRTTKGSKGVGGGLSLPAGSPEFVTASSVKARSQAIGHGMSDIYRQQQYFSRAVTFDQMDTQAALDQMRTILSLTPQRVYKTSYYRKQTKNHWARDDPAFAILEIVFILIASIAYCVAFKRPSIILSTIKFALQNILGIWLGLGIIVSSTGQFVANNYLAHHLGSGNGVIGDADGRHGGGMSNHHVRQTVEWLYAFDIHCNAFLPLFVVLYIAQFFLLPIVLAKSIFALVVSNTLYAIGISWYFYITHLGYRALPFLSTTEVFLFPIAAIVLLYLVNIVAYPLGFGFNASRVVAYLFFE